MLHLPYPTRFQKIELLLNIESLHAKKNPFVFQCMLGSFYKDVSLQLPIPSMLISTL